MSENPAIHIQDLTADDETAIQQVAAMLTEGFREHWWDAWPTLEEAVEEVRESFTEERISRIARDSSGAILGWIGGQPTYAEVWELHPLVVRVDQQRRGVGRLLVADLEQQVKERGGLTLMLGSDDQDEMTSLSGVDLYPDPWPHIAKIQNFKDHPYSFYQKLGYAIIGVVPDANGFGKPDILMAKRLA
uniref:Aminoglycoside 6'-N-acetyltransferase n=1 Tax=uncultured soil bacterium TaxID=164851 RepID=Q6Q235_9BACT|nr:aminoglycoside 6'-N-acetyltransferase [uncultured soil bacterium]